MYTDREVYREVDKIDSCTRVKILEISQPSSNRENTGRFIYVYCPVGNSTIRSAQPSTGSDTGSDTIVHVQTLQGDTFSKIPSFNNSSSIRQNGQLI